MADGARKYGVVFTRVLRAFERKVDLGNAVGVHRSIVDYWSRLGFVPHKYARRVSIACIRVGASVSEAELLTEADRSTEMIRALRERGVRGRSHRILRAANFIEKPAPATSEGE